MDLQGYPYVWLIVTFIVGFFAVRMAVGIWASRKVANAADYIVAGRRLPIYMVGASVMATWFAAETLMGASSTAYQYGFQGVIFDPFGAAACLFLSGFLFTRVMRRARYLTVVDFFDRRFGKIMTVLASILQLMTYFVWTGAQMVAAGTIVNALFPSVPLEVGMILVAVWVVGYTMLGGMLADTLLDFIQMFFTAGGVLLIFLFVMREVGGWSAMTSISETLYNPKPFTLTPDMQGEAGYLGYFGSMGWMYWIAAWMAMSNICRWMTSCIFSHRSRPRGYASSLAASIVRFWRRACAGSPDDCAVSMTTPLTVGVSVARRWFDQEGVDAIVDVPTSSVALAESVTLPETDAPTEGELKAFLETQKEKVKGKLVLVGKHQVIPVSFEAQNKRIDDARAKEMYAGNNPVAGGFGGRRQQQQQQPGQPRKLSGRDVNQRAGEFLAANGAMLMLTDTAVEGRMEQRRVRAFNNRNFDPARFPPAVVLSNEDYGRITRVLADGTLVQLAGNASYQAQVDEELMIFTPGGGGWGESKS